MPVWPFGGIIFLLYFSFSMMIFIIRSIRRSFTACFLVCVFFSRPTFKVFYYFLHFIAFNPTKNIQHLKILTLDPHHEHQMKWAYYLPHSLFVSHRFRTYFQSYLLFSTFHSFKRFHYNNNCTLRGNSHLSSLPPAFDEAWVLLLLSVLSCVPLFPYLFSKLLIIVYI